ncbi:response regulator [Lachnospiraceae bacterium 29-84]
MKDEAQISIHLLLASVSSVFSVILILVTAALSWELWIIPVALLGCFAVWFLHIGKIGSELLYENLCTGVIMGEFFFFGVHRGSLYELPMLACVMLLVFSFLERKRLLYITAALYVAELLYHIVILHTFPYGVGVRAGVRLGLGAIATAGAMVIARYRINRMQEEKRKYQDTVAQLETAGRQNADFLSNVSHELRTPINMVIGISEVTLGKDISPELQEDIQSIKMAGKRLSAQINNILDYTEIVEGTLAAAKESYRITSVINDVITTIVLQNSRRQLELVFDVDPRLPSVLVGDAEKISRVLKILLENSIKFTEEGGINVCVGFRQEAYGINLMIDIYDTGIGMTSSQMTQMLDDFYQADSGSRRYAGGLGLGIPIARGLLHAMGGFVHFASKGQQGMQVKIAIPQGVEDDTPGMVVDSNRKFCIACYFRPERYATDEVRRYYDNMILHLVQGLGIEGYQAHNFEGLMKLLREHDLTHVFIVQSVYVENHLYYEELANDLQVVVIADRKFTLEEGSKLLILRKPFFALSIVNLLNGRVQGNAFEKALATGRRSFSCAGIRVLAVDDEEMNLVVAKGILGSYGMKVDTCLSGREAVERCRNTSYDIVFLDHMMPGFDGVETLRRIREINNGAYKELPVVALTANTISGAREMFRDEGFTEFIPKPIERSVLERVLRRVLPKRCLQDSAASEEEGGTPDMELAGQPTEGMEETDGTGEENEEASDGQSVSYDALVKAGVNVQMGLDYCCGEESFYLDMLQMFYSQSKQKIEELILLYGADNWKDYAIKVHALKSTSLTIGAEQLSAQAKSLEHAGKRGDVDFIERNHPLLLQMYEEICTAIARI